MVFEQVAQKRLQPKGRILSQDSLQGVGKETRRSLIDRNDIPCAAMSAMGGKRTEGLSIRLHPVVDMHLEVAR
jgi:hypothetical protein